MIEELKLFLQQPYESSQAFVENVVFPVFGEENFEDAGNLDMFRVRPDLKGKADATGVISIKNIGSLYVDGSEMYIFDITLSKKKDLQHNRVEIQKIVRDIIATYSAAFIIFHYATGTKWEWRFTFCNKGATQTEGSDAKRYTFLLGPGQSCRTAAENFCKIHDKIEREGEFEIQDVIEAFDVEALSKEFFKKYKEQYEAFCQYVYQHKNDRSKFGVEFSQWEDKKVRDYVKKMLGRIVFLHFLQKKGWMGVPADKDWGDGDRQFMKNLFDHATQEQKNDYLDKVLEPLFADALDTDRTANDDLFDCGVEGFENVKVPYLNGGLFESDEMDAPKSQFPAEMFNSLFTFLYQYNFTIDENDPDDAAVGVDPEMLGRIFENLLEDNKDKGAFYTPKEIVQYMCKESLIAYLQTRCSTDRAKESARHFVETHDTEKIEQLFVQNGNGDRTNASILDFFDDMLKEVKICDPAIGSGAFPMGMLRELFFCRMAIEKSSNAAEIKKHIIQQNIYGVDIEKGAVDIARLRFWLCLIIDEETPHALPNLDFKIMQGNSLLEQYKGVDLSDVYNPSRRQLSLAFDDESAARTLLQVNIADYYKTDNHAKRTVLLNKINNAVRELVKAKTWKNRAIGNEIEALDFKNNQDFFMWHTWFSDVFVEGGFDIVIGNPPYIQLQADNGLLGGLYQGKGYETFASTGDIYCLFYELGHRLLRTDGHLCFITSNNWMRTNYGEGLRNFFAKKCNPKLLINFVGLQIFETATVETNILLLQKNRNEKKTICASISDVSDIAEEVATCGNMNEFVSSSAWVVLSEIENRIKNKFKKKGTLLKDCDVEIYRGVLTGYNEAFVITTEQRKAILAQCVTEAERLKTEKLIQPTLRGRDIKHYGYQWAGLWLINTHNGKRDGLAPIDIDEYPSVKRYLNTHWAKISKRGDKGITPYNLRNCAYLDDLQKPKIAWIELSDLPKFTYTEKEIPLNTVFFMVGEYLYYMLALLNSKAIYWYFTKMLGCTSGMGTNRWLKFTMEQLPIPIVDVNKQQPIVDIAKRIIEKKRVNINANISVEEHEIDKLIYRLYGLNDEEIAIIEK